MDTGKAGSTCGTAAVSTVLGERATKASNRIIVSTTRAVLCWTGGMFEVAVSGNGLEDFAVDASPAAAELVDTAGGNRAELEIGGVKARVLQCLFGLALLEMGAIRADCELAFVVDPNRLDSPHPAVGNRPVDFGQAPATQLLAEVRLHFVGAPAVDLGGILTAPRLRVQQTASR